MVHRKFIKVGKRTYGPYYYESYREGGKIKKRYIRVPEEKGSVNSRLIALYIILTISLILFTFFRYIGPVEKNILREIFPELLLSPTGASFGSNGNANLGIWDDTDLGENRFSNINVNFYANYTDISGSAIDNNNGNCVIRYNFSEIYGSFGPMIYDSISRIWNANKLFNYKGIHLFNVVCTSGFGDVDLDNSFIISNSEPDIFETPGGFINFDGNPFNNDYLRCIEDELCSYNFSANVSDPDINDVLLFTHIIGPNSTLTNFTLNESTGILAVFVTNDINTGEKKVELSAEDSDFVRDTAILLANITAVNDAPIFINLENKSFNMSYLFDYVIRATDEENNLPFGFHIEFLSCETAQWSSRQSTNCELFNSSQFYVNDSVINISFIPTRNDVGIYLINFSVNDSGIPSARTSVVANFSVLNINSEPYFNYVCDNERGAVESSAFSCYINATDIDEINNLTFFSDLPWFLNVKSIKVNSSTNFNGAVAVNFVPEDGNVGNWSVNVSVIDTGNPIGLNSTQFWFFVENVNDSVKLQNLGSVDAYTSNNYTIYINATDDDLLIPDKSVYNEIISFSSNESWVQISSFGTIQDTNITTAIVRINPNRASGSGAYGINISAVDANLYSIDSKILIVNVIGNFRPQWDLNTRTAHSLLEDTGFYLNLSENVSDADGDSISFSYASDNIFSSFTLDANTGVIDFAPNDLDIGQHIVTINASDIAASSPLVFNFTVQNLNDVPFIERPLQGNNASINITNSNMETMEDNRVDIFLFIQDDDLKIPESQAGFYKESLRINLTIEGPNIALFDFSIPTILSPNKSLFTTTFTPRKSDIGDYNITINAIDFANASDTIAFNLSISEIQHYPMLNNLTNQTSGVNITFYYDINATDIEDGDDTEGNLTFSYAFLSGNDFINNDESIFNTTYGIFNITFNDNQGGIYHLNISVSDLSGRVTSGELWIFVYGLPVIFKPGPNFIFNLAEGKASNLAFAANSSILENLTYRFYINWNLRGNFISYGDGRDVIWQAIPDYVDESYGLYSNLTLVVSTPGLDYLNSSMTWNANITHTNAPLRFINNIGDKQANVGQQIRINLTNHFSDVDAFDIYYNQSVVFNLTSNKLGSLITYSISDWLLSISSSAVTTEILNVSGGDLGSGPITNATSNNFEVKFTEPLIVEVPKPVPVPTSGGASQEKPISLKIILPGPVSAKQGQMVTLPIELVNTGDIDLYDINLNGIVAKDGNARDDVSLTFDRTHFDSLLSGDRENLTLQIKLLEGEVGTYEVTVNADVGKPDYFDWGKIFINVLEGETIFDKLVFVEEFVVANPECAEIQELVDESREFIAIGNFNSAEQKMAEALDACKRTISQQSFFSKYRTKVKFQDKIFVYLLIASIVAVMAGIAYYAYKTILFRKALQESLKQPEKVSFGI